MGNRIAYISQLPHGKALILQALDDNNPPLVDKLANRFGLEEMLNPDKNTHFMASLLYYLGVLTLAGETAFAEIVLKIPGVRYVTCDVERPYFA